MCRLLLVRSDQTFDIAGWLKPFADMCQQSPEYQGHGWGMAYRVGDQWEIHKQLEPIWESAFNGFGETRWLLVHARSAFRNEGIELPNNMPFSNDGRIFIFNGELHGVRIKEEGRIGAEKIFNYILRFHKGDLGEALTRATDIIAKRSRYVRAMNILMSDGERIYCSSRFSQDPDYFTMYRHSADGADVFCSHPLGEGWVPIPNHTTMVA